MGATIACTARAGGKTADGTALLETSEIVFRSDELRLKIPFDQIKKVEAKDGGLRVTHAGGTAILGIGEKEAAKWAEKIRNPKSLLDKLGVRPEHRVVAIGVSDASFIRLLRARAPDVTTRVRKDADVIFFEANSVPELARLKRLEPSIKRDGMVWLITPKGKGGVGYDDMLAAAKGAGLVDVKISAYNATHTATKLVVPKALR